MKNIVGAIAFLLIAFYVVAYTFNHIDPWVGIIIALGLLVVFFKFITPKIKF